MVRVVSLLDRYVRGALAFRLSHLFHGFRPVAWAVLAVFLLAACSTGGAPAGRNVESAPDFELALFGNENHAPGEILKLSQYEGQPVIINFWFPTCGPCRVEMPHLEETFKRHKADGLHFIGVQLVALDSMEDGQDFIDEFGITYPVGPDLGYEIHMAYKIVRHPTTVFLDKNHVVARSWPGPLNTDKLEEILEPLLQ